MVSTRFKKQNRVALSFTESEYLALPAAASEDIWPRGAASDFGLCANGIVQLSRVSQTALQISE